MKKTVLIISATLAVIFLLPLQEVYATMHLVTVANFSFTPDNINNVRIGDTVRWVWESGTHTTTSTTIPAGALPWDNPITSVNTTFDYIPAVSGVYNYKCTPHAAMGMLGSFTVLNTTGTVAPPALSSMVLYPNPFVDNVSVRIESAGSVKCTLTVRDIAGRVILQTPFDVGPGITVRPVELDFLNPGIFFFEFTTSDGAAIIRKMIRAT
jgi:plastocyanin